MRNHLRFALLAPLLAALNLPADVVGQASDSIPRIARSPSSTGLEVRVRGGGAFMGNFFQLPSGVPHENVRAATGEMQLAVPFASRSQVFARFGGTLYSQFNRSANLDAGLRWGSPSHALQAYAGYLWRAPRLEVGSTLGFANIVHLEGSYAARPVRSIELEALAQYYDETYSRSPEKANTFVDLGGALRVRGLDLFSPEVGAAFGTRDVVTDTEDFTQRTVWATLRSTPTRSLYLSLRYRRQLREYTVRDAALSNFARRDWRHQLAVTTSLALRHDLGWTAYYAFERAASTKASRNFNAQYLWMGLTYRLW